MLPPDTYTVSQLGEELQLILSETLSGVWVAGEVRRPTTSRAGHLYFELVEKGRGDSVKGAMQAVLFRMDHQRVQRNLKRSGIELAEGQTIRCFGAVDFYPAGGRLQLIARDVDPLFSLGDLAQRRQETLRSLADKGLLDLNASLALPDLPLRIVLLTSAASAAAHDFLATIDASRYSFEVHAIDVTVQGPQAERDIVNGLEQAARLLATDQVDLASSLIVLIRGGGSKTDLAVFDSLAVAEAVAASPLPVLTGLGHEIDESLADLVAHQAFKTPTAVAEFLVQTVTEAERKLDSLTSGLLAASERTLNRAVRSFGSAELRLRSAGALLARQRAELEGLAERLRLLSRSMTRDGARGLRVLEQRLARSAAPSLARARVSTEAAGRSLLRRSRRVLKEAQHSLQEQQRLVDQLSLERTLKRGFSITRRQNGEVVRSSAEVGLGDMLETQLGTGTITSAVSPSDAPDA